MSASSSTSSSSPSLVDGGWQLPVGESGNSRNLSLCPDRFSARLNLRDPTSHQFTRFSHVFKILLSGAPEVSD